MGDRDRVDVPELGELLDVPWVLPVAKAREVAVCAGLTVVLRGRLAVHLQDAGARAADHPAQQVDVVDGAGRGRRLVRLVEALQHGREQTLRRADELRGTLEVPNRDVTDLGGPTEGAATTVFCRCSKPNVCAATYS